MLNIVDKYLLNNNVNYKSIGFKYLYRLYFYMINVDIKEIKIMTIYETIAKLEEKTPSAIEKSIRDSLKYSEYNNKEFIKKMYKDIKKRRI